MYVHISMYMRNQFPENSSINKVKDLCTLRWPNIMEVFASQTNHLLGPLLYSQGLRHSVFFFF